MFDIADTGLDDFVESTSGDILRPCSCASADPATMAGTFSAVAFRDCVLLLSLL
jgi:hypothetical protein